SVPAATVPRGPIALATTDQGSLPTHASRLQKAMFPGGGGGDTDVICVAHSGSHRRASLHDDGSCVAKHRATRAHVPLYAHESSSAWRPPSESPPSTRSKAVPWARSGARRVSTSSAPSSRADRSIADRTWEARSGAAGMESSALAAIFAARSASLTSVSSG